MPVQVVLRDVEHRGGRGLKVHHAVELKTRQLQHPHLGKRARVDMGRQRIEQRGADIAGHGHGFARALDQLARERRDRGLAIGAGDCQHRWRIPVRSAQCGKGHGIQA